jgi:hypothetical protein
MLRAYEEKFSTLQALSDHLQPLGEYYDVAADYVNEWNQVMVSGVSIWLKCWN